MLLLLPPAPKRGDFRPLAVGLHVLVEDAVEPVDAVLQVDDEEDEAEEPLGRAGVDF